MPDKETDKAGYGRRREQKTKSLNFRLSNSDMNLLNELSCDLDESVSQIIRRAVKEYAKKHEENKT